MIIIESLFLSCVILGSLGIFGWFCDRFGSYEIWSSTDTNTDPFKH